LSAASNHQVPKFTDTRCWKLRSLWQLRCMTE